ncbi:CBO0543 family protein [Bacillus sp. J33]|uniref:CBO0543 family protein n=1 Tax=Bacillus sp. J33 TaxID=935836 RepID=UPI00047E0544|nr:CBO0543 family protein [Bacillus sp. J33]
MNFQDGLNLIDKANKMITEANKMITEATYNAFLFTWNWWIALGMLVIPWILWGVFRKKDSSSRLLFAGFIVMILSSILDSYGVDRGKFAYPVKVIPLPTLSYSFRYSMVPVTIMFLLQYKPHLNPLIKAILFAGFSAYIGMPLMAMIHLYKKVDWAYTYSFFILFSLFMIAHWFSRRKSFGEIAGDSPEQ